MSDSFNMATISITRTKQEIAVILIGNAWKEGVTMGVELELLLISTKIFLNQTRQRTHPPNPELTTMKKDNDQYEKGCQEC